MFDRLLVTLLRLVITGLIAASCATLVIGSYVGFTWLVRAQVREACWMFLLAGAGALVAYGLVTRRGDLADC